MADQAVVTEVDGAVARVWLNRPDKLNGVDLDVVEGLVDAARRLRANRNIRAVVIEGRGPSFCAGLDFGAVTRASKLRIASLVLPNLLRGRNAFQECNWAWRELPVPVIAVTRGHVFGAGIQLALCADFRFTTPDCQWAVLEAKWGLIPDMAGTVPLAELVGVDVAKRLVMTGEVISGEQAVEIGLATGADVDPGKLADELIASVIERSPDSVAAAKQLMNRARRGGLRSAFARERWAQLAVFRAANGTVARKAGKAGETPNFGPRTVD